MRLIDADALVAEIIDLGAKIAVPDETGVIDDLIHAACEMCADALNIIKEQPTINPDDLRPHGRWELYPSSKYRRCSACKVEFDKPRFGFRSNYCPNCGAKMDGKENEDA